MLAMITGVGLQGLGRLALARVCMKTEKVINDAHAASEADDFSGRNGQVGESEARNGGGGGGGGWGGGGGATSPDRRHDPASLKINRVSSSIGEGGRLDVAPQCVLFVGRYRLVAAPKARVRYLNCLHR